jgi:amino acid transporter
MDLKNSPKPIAAPIQVTGKGLKKNALSLLSNMVIGVASAAPAYSLASALGPIAVAAGFTTPAIMLTAFFPMLFIALAFFYLNRRDPDCGTTFAWVTLAMGPTMGWIGGWALLVTNIIVMPSMSVVAGQYTFLLFGYNNPPPILVTAAGVAWIAALTAICYLGIELSARTQQVLLATELAVLLLFAAAALVKVYAGAAPEGAMPVSAEWFNPFKIASFEDFLKAFLVAVFIYWGWDTGLSVNEETENPETTPGNAAILSTFLLVGVYVLVAVSAIAFAGPKGLAQNSEADTDDVFAAIGHGVLGGWLDKLFIVAVLTSAAAATQTTILPAARTALSMASAGAIPRRFAEVDPRRMTPGFATLVMGAISAIYFVGLRNFSKNVLDDSIEALGLCISFYYALTGFACVIVYRKELLKSLGNFILMGLLPGAGGLIMLLLLVESCISLAGKGTVTVFGVGLPLAVALASLLIGLILMLAARMASPAFFRGEPARTAA